MNQLCFATNLTSEKWAAWVQAIGSILAILASAILVWWQHKLEIRREQDGRRSKEISEMDAIGRHVEVIRMQAERLATAMLSRDASLIKQAYPDSSQAESYLASVPASRYIELGIWQAWSAPGLAQQTLNLTINAFGNIEQFLAGEPALVDEMSSRLVSIAAKLSDIERSVINAISKMRAA